MILANTLPWMKWMALLMFYSEKVPILRYTLKHVENPPSARFIMLPLSDAEFHSARQMGRGLAPTSAEGSWIELVEILDRSNQIEKY